MLNNGFIHIYCGDGKGKTSAATGLAVRCAGAGKRVLFVQFFKDGTSSEIKNLKLLDGIDVLTITSVPGFYYQMNDTQKEITKKDYTRLFLDTVKLSVDYDLLVLDEIISACNCEVVNEMLLTQFLDDKSEKLEVVLTGRDPSRELLNRADYITEMKSLKHPYDQGIIARKGIEF